jgi:hypothetical protein
MGLLADQAKPGGCGTTNDGNTARRFFKDPSHSASITGISEMLIRRCAVILQTVSSGHTINLEAFDQYAKETAVLLVKEYPWYYVPASVHKVLMHGAQVVAAAMLPIGQISEEAQESLHKQLKAYRERYSRKCSRISTNTDLIHSLLVSSDPFITNLRPLPRKRTSGISKDMLKLISLAHQQLCESSDLDGTESGSSEDEKSIK